MGTVTVTGRDELGRIIDVTLTTNADVAPPGPEIASSGDSALPDPAEAPDGQVPTTADGEYELAVGEILVVTSALTAAEIRTLWSVGYELLPEVPDFAYWPLSAFAVSHITDGFGDTAGQKLSLAGGAVYYMELGTGAAPALFTISKFAVFDLLTAVTDDSAGAVGPMRIDLDTMDLTAEVGDGTLDVTVFYRLVDVS